MIICLLHLCSWHLNLGVRHTLQDMDLTFHGVRITTNLPVNLRSCLFRLWHYDFQVWSIDVYALARSNVQVLTELRLAAKLYLDLSDGLSGLNALTKSYSFELKCCG